MDSQRSLFASLKVATELAVIAPKQILFTVSCLEPAQVFVKKVSVLEFISSQRDSLDCNMAAFQGRVFAREILAISFTNKAATELRERLKSLGSEGADSVRVGTFHSWCFAVLRQNYKAAGFEKAPVVWATESDRKTAISEAIRLDGEQGSYVQNSQ